MFSNFKPVATPSPGVHQQHHHTLQQDLLFGNGSQNNVVKEGPPTIMNQSSSMLMASNEPTREPQQQQQRNYFQSSSFQPHSDYSMFQEDEEELLFDTINTTNSSNHSSFLMMGHPSQSDWQTTSQQQQGLLGPRQSKMMTHSFPSSSNTTAMKFSSNNNNNNNNNIQSSSTLKSPSSLNQSFSSQLKEVPTKSNHSIFVSSKEQLPQCMDYLNNKLNNTMALLPLMSYYSDLNAIGSFKLDFNNPDNDIFVTNVIYYLLKEREEEAITKATLQDKIRRLQCDQNAISLNNNKLEQKASDTQKLYAMEQQKYLNLQKETRLKLKKLESAKTSLETQNKNIQQKCDQYEHNLIKMEKEMDKLKQQMTHKLNTMLMNAGNPSNKVDVLNQSNHPAISSPALTLPHNRSFNSGMWKHGLERNEDILYQNVVEAFKDEKQEILAENQQLKRSLRQLNTELNHLRQRYSSTTSYDGDTIRDGQFELPYHLAQDEIETAIREKIQDLNHILERATMPSPSHREGMRLIHHQQQHSILQDDEMDDELDQVDFDDKTAVKSAIETLQSKCNQYKQMIKEQETLIDQLSTRTSLLRSSTTTDDDLTHFPKRNEQSGSTSPNLDLLDSHHHHHELLLHSLNHEDAITTFQPKSINF
nr:unnamed protein product [Naegleria fowleri]